MEESNGSVNKKIPAVEDIATVGMEERAMAVESALDIPVRDRESWQTQQTRKQVLLPNGPTKLFYIKDFPAFSAR